MRIYIFSHSLKIYVCRNQSGRGSNMLIITDNIKNKSNSKYVPEYMLFQKDQHSGGFFFGTKNFNVRQPGFLNILNPYSMDFYVMKPPDREGHICICGDPGSGKTSCLAIPTLLNWRRSAFVIDIKGDLYKNTKHKRPNIRVFDPKNPDALGYDPFYILKDSKNPAQDALTISCSLIPLPHDVKNPFWKKSARNLLTGAIIYCYYAKKLSFIDAMKKIVSTPVAALVEEIDKETRSTRNESVKKAVYFNNAFVGMPEDTLGGIYAELHSNLEIYATDEDIIRCLSKEECINPNDLENKHDVYICIPEHLLYQWKSLLNLMVSQFLHHFEQRPDMNETPILFMIDEFARLGRIEGVTEAFATLRSKKITICVVFQDFSQVDLIYGHNERRTILATCGYQVILNVMEVSTQEYFSKAIGAKISNANNIGINFTPSGEVSGYGCRSSETRVPIIYPEEFKELKDIIIICHDGYFRVNKAPYS